MSWNLDKISPQDTITSPYEKHISEKDDKRLTDYIQGKIREVSSVKKPFIYFGIGTANENANMTNDSGDIDTEKLSNQQKPKKLLDFASEKGYTPIVINIDEYEGNDFFYGVFPLSGYSCVHTKLKQADSLSRVAELFDTAIGKGGFVVMLNAVADLPADITNPDLKEPEDEAEGEKNDDSAAGFNTPTFYLFSGFEKIMFMMDLKNVKERFVYASGFLAERDYYNLYRPVLLSNEKQSFIYKLAQDEISLEDVLE